ncbi:MAG: helix-turn-helix domain-containing protein [Chloroflexi bacterium]|nr:helix-turn-helix domain-containing protein [Chloroflexota bacterium]
MEPLLLRPPDAAAALGVSRSRLYELLAAGALASVKIGASRRIALDDRRAFVERLRSEQAAERGA